MARRFIYCVPLMPLVEDSVARRFIYCVSLMEDRSGSLIYLLYALMEDRSGPLIYLLCAPNGR